MFYLLAPPHDAIIECPLDLEEDVELPMIKGLGEFGSDVVKLLLHTKCS
jgi:hypothetical protein